MQPPHVTVVRQRQRRRRHLRRELRVVQQSAAPLAVSARLRVRAPLLWSEERKRAPCCSPPASSNATAGCGVALELAWERAQNPGTLSTRAHVLLDGYRSQAPSASPFVAPSTSPSVSPRYRRVFDTTRPASVVCTRGKKSNHTHTLRSHSTLAPASTGNARTPFSKGAFLTPQQVGRFLFLVCRRVNSTLDSKHGC